jgi:hypothetical protein
MAVTYKGKVYAAFNKSTAAAHAVAAAKTGYQVVVHGVKLIATGAQTITLEDSAGTDMSGPCDVAAEGGFVLNPSGEPWMVTPDGTGFSILLGQAVQTGGIVIYEYVSTDV